jgi:serine/threonine protein kinase
VTVVAGYELLELLGRGGMGSVHLGRHPTSGRLVAVKMMDPRLAEDREDFIERFRREGELLRSIQHRCLPDIYDLGFTETGEAYLVMEYLRGEPLGNWAGRHPLDTIPLLIQICGALREIAARGVVHRDLSPDNVLVVLEGRNPLAKIIDFGIAKETGRTTQLTSTGLFIGKLQYCSPEQLGSLAEDEAIDWRSDLYSFGVVAYRVLSGDLPFRATTPVGFVSAHLRDKPRPLQPAAPGVTLPPRLRDLLSRLLAKDRSERPRSYEEVIRALSLAHAELLISGGPVAAAPPKPPDAAKSETDPTRVLSRTTPLRN